MNVHNYCDDRAAVGALACISSLFLVLLLRNRGTELWVRLVSDLAILVCFLTIFGDITFIWYVTKLCHHMLEGVAS